MNPGIEKMQAEMDTIESETPEVRLHPYWRKATRLARFNARPALDPAITALDLGIGGPAGWKAADRLRALCNSSTSVTTRKDRGNG